MLFFRAYMDQWFLSEELYQHIEDVVMERGLTFYFVLRLNNGSSVWKTS